MKIESMRKGEWGKILAFFDLTTSEGFTIKGFKIVKSPDGGFFVGFPSQKNKDDEYHDTIWASKELKQQVNQIAHEVYNNNEVVAEEDSDIPF